MIEVYVKETKMVVLEEIKTNFLDDIGSTEEVSAVVLHFNLPQSVCGKAVCSLSKKVMFKNKRGFSELPIPENGVVELGMLQTEHPLLEFQVKLYEDDFSWKTFPKIITLAESLDYDAVEGSETNIVTDTENRIKRGLIEALSEATGDDYDESTSFEELFGVIDGFTNLEGLKSSLMEILPKMNFDKMNDVQFKYSVNELLGNIADEPETSFVVDLPECSTDLDDDGNLVVDEEEGMPLIAISYKTRYSQSQLDGAVNERTEELAASLTDNFGEDYTGDSWEELVGVYSEVEGEGAESSPDYHYQNGALWQLRTALKELRDYIAPFVPEDNGNVPPACYASIANIESDIDYIKERIVIALNETLEPTEELTTDDEWSDIVEEIEGLPSSVGLIIAQSVGSSSESLRESVDEAIDQIAEEYDLSVGYISSNWDSTLRNLVAVCGEISEVYEGRIEDIEASIDELSLCIEAVTGVRPSNFLEFKNLIEEFNPSLREAIEAATGDAVDEGLLYEDLVNLVKDMQTGGEVTPQNVYIPFSFTEESGEKIDLAFVTDEDGQPCIITGETEE